MIDGIDTFDAVIRRMQKADKPARALFWVSPAGKLEALFEALHDMTDVPAVIETSARHDVDFLPPEAND